MGRRKKQRKKTNTDLLIVLLEDSFDLFLQLIDSTAGPGSPLAQALWHSGDTDKNGVKVSNITPHINQSECFIVSSRQMI